MQDDNSSSDLKVMIAGIFLLALAVICWLVRDVLPSMSASAFAATAELSSNDNPEVADFHRSLQSALRDQPTKAWLEPLGTGDGPKKIRLWVEATEAVEARRQMNRLVAAMRLAFAEGNTGQLDAEINPETTLLPNEGKARLAAVLRFCTIVLALLGIFLIILYRRHKRPISGSAETPQG